MGKVPKLRTTLRKTPAKDTPADVTSESSEAVSNNPWAAETPLQKVDSLSAPLSRTSSQPLATGSAAKDSDDVSDKSSNPAVQHLDVPANGSVSGSGADELPKARRKKTITKTTPHTFELEDELKPKPQQVAYNREESDEVPGTSPRLPSAITFSSPTTILDANPVEPSVPSPSPSSHRRFGSAPGPNNPFTSQRQHRKSSSTNTNGATISSGTQPYRFIPATSPLNSSSFFNKVVVISHGSSLISSNLIQQFHAAGARVIFGETNIEKSRKLISSLGPPDVIHFNRCDVAKYDDIVELFQLAVTIYGRVDHAVFGMANDTGAARGVGEGEKLWGLELGSKGRNKTAKEALAEVRTEADIDGIRISDLITAPARFARVAMAYLKYTPKGPKMKRLSTMNSSTNTAEAANEEPKQRVDRSLTFITSTASFKGIPHLTAYQIASHALLGVVRNLSASVDLQADGIRVNAVCTNVMIPTAKTMAGGRMSVQLPLGRVEDVARIVAGVIGDGSLLSSTTDSADQVSGAVHGRILYVTGDEAVDIDDGLRRSEKGWLGEKGKDVMASAEEGWKGEGVEWMLMDALE